MNYIEIALAVIAVVLLVPSMVIFIQVLLACLPRIRTEYVPAGNMKIAVLIPAHNEASGIADTLYSIRSQLRPGDRMLVVADNCNDDTAKIARKSGAEVIERRDIERRGKGFALDFGIRYLAKSPPDVVVIIDADCLAAEAALPRLAAAAMSLGRPVQALYLMYANDPSLRSRIAEFAWCVKNLVRPLGYAKLDLPCQLMGTGMAFAWSTIENADLANGNIVEDMKLGIDLCKSGRATLFYPDALVTSYFPIAAEVQSGQRARWEHGHLAMIIAEAPGMLVKGITKLDRQMIAMAFDLSVPPLALLVFLLLGYAMVSGLVVALFGTGVTALLVTLVAIALVTFSIVIAWWGWGRKIISLRDLLLVPVYVALKIPHYIRFLFKRQKSWNKTERDSVS